MTSLVEPTDLKEGMQYAAQPGRNAKFFLQGIHGLVAKRLLLAWILLSFSVGGTVAYLEMRRVDELALSLALAAAQSLRAHVAEEGDQHVDSLKAVLQTLIGQSYLHAQVNDKAGKVMAEVNASDKLDLFTRLAGQEPQAPALTSTTHRTFWLAHELIVKVNAPLQDRSGSTIGAFSGTYQVDDVARQHAQSELVRNVTVALFAVLVSAIALYPVIIALNKGVVQLSAGLMHSNIELMEVLGSAIAKRDSDTDLHNYRVCLYSIRFAQACGLSAKDIRIVITGAFLHDAGKIGISDAILHKPGNLTAEEFFIMKSHVQLGVDIVAKASWLEGARDVIRFHHEHFDGSGYLEGLQGNTIPLAARLFAIVDVFDALTSRRPYKEPLALEQAMDILAKGSGSHFDPFLFDIFEPIGASLFSEISMLTATELSSQLHDQVTKYFFEDNDLRRHA